MVKAAKFVFVLLSVFLTVALCFACATVSKNGESGEPAANSSADVAFSSADGSDDEKSAMPSEEESSAEAAESSEEESSEEESSEEESSEEESSEEESLPPAPPLPPSEPITPPPDSPAKSDCDNYFDNSVFVGHSVMVHFKNYVSSRRNIGIDTLGSASLCCTSSFSLFNNLNQKPSQPDNVLPKYRGQAYNIEDLPEVTGADTVYLGLMGLNDLGVVGSSESCARIVADEFAETVALLKEKKPDLKIAVLASTYLVRGKSYPHLNNRNMSLLNSYVLEYCNKNGIDFIDVASPLTNGDGYLADVYSSDDYCHLTTPAYHVWMNVLHDYAEQKTEGSWKNPESIRLFEN